MDPLCAGRFSHLVRVTRFDTDRTFDPLFRSEIFTHYRYRTVPTAQMNYGNDALLMLSTKFQLKTNFLIEFAVNPLEIRGSSSNRYGMVP
jgi:hypothetical protein